MCSEYYNSLEVVCEGGYMHQYGLLNWTVASDTPDLVYYQSYTHEVQRGGGGSAFLAEMPPQTKISLILEGAFCLLSEDVPWHKKVVNWIPGTT
jgi:hypothetical protein